MSERFFLNEACEGDRAVLRETEAHHLLHVLRAKLGDEVTLFDGSGHEFSARVAKLGRSEVELAILDRREVDREPRVRLTLGVALPKGDRQKWLVEKATELGVAVLTPLVTERSVAEAAVSALERLRRSVIEAAKQCGRNRLMEIAPPQELAAFAVAHSGEACLVADPRAETSASAFRQQWQAAQHNKLTVTVGPEGGFTSGELELLAQHHFQPVSLGRSILRIETACLALAALFLMET